jgi:hypothetical protein
MSDLSMDAAKLESHTRLGQSEIGHIINLDADIYIYIYIFLYRPSFFVTMGTLRPPCGQMVTFRTYHKMLMKSQGLNIFWNGLCQNS